MVTVSQEEAVTLLAGGGWEVYTPPEKTAPLLDKTARPAVRKSAAHEDTTAIGAETPAIG